MTSQLPAVLDYMADKYEQYDLSASSLQDDLATQ